MTVKVHRIDTSVTSGGAAFHEVEIDILLGAFVIGSIGAGTLDAKGRMTGTVTAEPNNVCQIALGAPNVREYMTAARGFYIAKNGDKASEKLIVRYEVQPGFIEILETDPCKYAVGFLA